MTEKCIEIHGKWDLVGVTREFKFSEFESSRFYSINLLS